MATITQRILAIVLRACACSSAVVAKDEHHKIITTWPLLGGGSGDFNSQEAVIGAFNTRAAATYTPACNGQPAVGPTSTHLEASIGATAIMQRSTDWSVMGNKQRHTKTARGVHTPPSAVNALAVVEQISSTLGHSQ